MTADDLFTMEARLCDDDGMVSHEKTPPNAFDPELTYLKQLNNLRAHNRNPDARKPYDGEPFTCTGSAHLGGEHIRCTSPAHCRTAHEHRIRLALMAVSDEVEQRA